MKGALVDTGPLVAIFNRNDQHHSICLEALRELPAPLLTCWPVITEAVWLLRGQPKGLQSLLASFESGLLALLPLAGSEIKPIAALLTKYQDIRPQLADAALIYLAERDSLSVIFTLDRRDFTVYQSARKPRFRIVPN